MFTLSNLSGIINVTNNKADDENVGFTSEIDFQYQIGHQNEHLFIIIWFKLKYRAPHTSGSTVGALDEIN